MLRMSSLGEELTTIQPGGFKKVYRSVLEWCPDPAQFLQCTLGVPKGSVAVLNTQAGVWQLRWDMHLVPGEPMCDTFLSCPQSSSSTAQPYTKTRLSQVITLSFWLVPEAVKYPK